MGRPPAILFAVLVGLGLLLPGSARNGVVCLGEGHEHAHGALAASGIARCFHKFGLVSRDDDHHDEHCHCTDLPVSGPAIVWTQRSDDVPLPIGFAPLCDSWIALIADHGPRSTGRPRAPPWFDPGCARRLAEVASVRLII
jgi:hypothetical protein